MNDAAYHHHQSTSANLLAHVNLAQLAQNDEKAATTANDNIVAKPKEESK